MDTTPAGMAVGHRLEIGAMIDVLAVSSVRWSGSVTLGLRHKVTSSPYAVTECEEGNGEDMLH